MTTLKFNKKGSNSSLSARSSCSKADPIAICSGKQQPLNWILWPLGTMEGLHTGPQTGANLTQTSGIMRAYLALKQASGSPFLMSILTFAILSTSLILFGLWLVCKSFLRDDDTRDQLAKKEPPKANQETHQCSGPSPGQKLPRRPAPDVPTSSMMPPGPTPQGVNTAKLA